MAQAHTTSSFHAKLLRPATLGRGPAWAFVVLPKEVSRQLPRRGRTTVQAAINGQAFLQTLEPDGQLSHWLRVSAALCEAAGACVGDMVALEITAVEQEPEPETPADFGTALAASPQARKVWDATTTLARLDWIHWITSAKQAKTRTQRIADACDMLAAGKKRVCCFDPSGHYSKTFKAPEAAA